MKCAFKIIIISFLLFTFLQPDQAQNLRRKGFNKFKKAETEIDFSITPAYTQLRSDVYSSEESKRPGFLCGVNLGYYFANYSDLVMGLGIGANVSMYQTSRNASTNDTFNIVDYENETILANEVALVKETQKVFLMSFPITIKTYYSLGLSSVYFAMGGEFELPLSGSFSQTGTYSRIGYYPRTNSPIPSIYIPGSTYYFPSNLNLSNFGKLNLDFGFSLVTSVGVRYRLSARYTAFAGFNLVYGLKRIDKVSTSTEYQLSPDYDVFNSLMTRGDKVSNLAYGMQLGISIGLGKMPAAKKTSKK